MLYGLLHAPAGPVRDAQQYELRARADRRTRRAGAGLRRPHVRPATRCCACRWRRWRSRCCAAGRGAELQQLHGHRVRAGACRRPGQTCSNTAWAACCARRSPKRWTRPAPGRPAASAWPTTPAAVTACWPSSRRPATTNPADAPRAYVAGLTRVFPRLNAPYAPPRRHAWPRSTRSGRMLDALEPLGKELLIEGLVAAISHDGQVSVPRRNCCARSAPRCTARCRRCSTVRRRGRSCVRTTCARPPGVGVIVRGVEKTSCFLHAAAPGVLPRSADDAHPRRPHGAGRASKRQQARKPLFPMGKATTLRLIFAASGIRGERHAVICTSGAACCGSYVASCITSRQERRSRDLRETSPELPVGDVQSVGATSKGQGWPARPLGQGRPSGREVARADRTAA